jgi:serine/threonine-protein kinase RsbT
VNPITPPDRGELAPTLHLVLARHTSKIVAKAILDDCCRRCRIQGGRIRGEDLPRVMAELEKGLALFLKDERKKALCLADLAAVPGTSAAASVAPPEEIHLDVKTENDIVRARTLARDLCLRLGFSLGEQTKVATVVSELTRNVVMYAGGGKASFLALRGDRPGIHIVVEDQGPGIEGIDGILSGKHVSRTGMGLGLCGSKRLMDEFSVETEKGKGTRVVARKYRL